MNLLILELQILWLSKFLFSFGGFDKLDQSNFELVSRVRSNCTDSESARHPFSQHFETISTFVHLTRFVSDLGSVPKNGVEFDLN